MKKMLKEIEELKVRAEYFELRARIIEGRNRITQATALEKELATTKALKK